MKHKPKRTIPEISTASLPDIIFILLFFFMVVTVMRTDTPQISTVLPTTTYATRLVKPIEGIVLRVGADPAQIEVQGRVVPMTQLHDYIRQSVQGFSPNELQDLQIIMHADRTTRMTDIRAVKSVLQKNGLRNLRYISTTSKQPDLLR